MPEYTDKQTVIDAVRSYYDECDEREESIEERIAQLPSADELAIVTEYCRKRDLVLITMESFRVLQAYCNRQNGTDGKKDG